MFKANWWLLELFPTYLYASKKIRNKEPETLAKISSQKRWIFNPPVALDGEGSSISRWSTKAGALRGANARERENISAAHTHARWLSTTRGPKGKGEGDMVQRMTPRFSIIMHMRRPRPASPSRRRRHRTRSGFSCESGVSAVRCAVFHSWESNPPNHRWFTRCGFSRARHSVVAAASARKVQGMICLVMVTYLAWFNFKIGVSSFSECRFLVQSSSWLTLGDLA